MANPPVFSTRLTKGPSKMFTDHGHARAGAARTKRSIGRFGVLGMLAALFFGFLPTSPASADVTAGTWTQHPSGAPAYQAEVQQPINTTNTSNWSSKSKGGIPVMFKLSARPTPAAFESVFSDSSTSNDYAFVSFTPSSTLTFGQLTELKTDYTFTEGDCHGGSLRWSVRTSPTQSVFIYYGSAPSFADCTTANQSDMNMIGDSDLRYDTSQYADGTFYDSYDHALELLADAPVIRASLVLDSGWAGDQRASVSNTTVNGNSYDFVTSSGGTLAPTCDLPPATIRVGQGDVVTDGEVNEAPVQSSLSDSGSAFRVIDCKYQYVLSIPSLQGKGTYEVQIWIGGARVPTPTSPGGKVTFDLK